MIELKTVYLDFDGTLYDFNDNMFWDLNKDLQEKKIFFELDINIFHKSKHIVKEYISISKENQKQINDLFLNINDYFGLKDSINLENMNKRHKKMTDFFKENKEQALKLEKEINSSFKQNNHYLRVKCSNVSKYENYIKDFYKDKRGFYKNSELFSGAIEFIEQLKFLGYEVIILTSNMYPTQKEYKNNYIKEYIGDKIDGIIHARHKFKYTKNGFLVDDKLKNVLDHIKKNNIIGVYFNESEKTKEDELLLFKSKNYKDITDIIQRKSARADFFDEGFQGF